jgi:DNA/RNA-binding domain of Phe-tRNA-synthetase-like protein
MFMEELRNMLLTAGHDLDAVQTPLKLDAAKGNEKYTRMNGQEQVLKAGDMMIADSVAVISSVIYGPDRRTMITPATKRVLFTVYAVPGIGAQAVRQHLKGIEANIRLVSPDAQLELLEVYGTE